MMYKIMKSKYLTNNQDWFSIVSTILSAKKAIVAKKNNSGYTKLSYFKNFQKFTLEVSVIKYSNNLYVVGVNKNAQLELSSMY